MMLAFPLLIVLGLVMAILGPSLLRQIEATREPQPVSRSAP
jgi:hypothetical protein